MDPKIADFGLARLQVGGHTQTMTARVVGTYSSISFGVFVLAEIVTKRRNCGSDGCETDTMIDESLEGHPRIQALRCMYPHRVAVPVVQADPDDRPDIPSIIFMLNRDDMEPVA
uniref:Protein kinase domain-containing protein n=1 Tax=Aegilops tauschii TaxID=37682 RepID=M8CB28_AEGTA